MDESLHQRELADEEAVADLALHSRTTPGDWMAFNTDDQVCMNVYGVCTGHEPDYGDDWKAPDEKDHGSVVALTLFQAPRVVGHKAQCWEEDAEFISRAHRNYPKALRDLLRAREENVVLVERLKQALAALQEQGERTER